MEMQTNYNSNFSSKEKPSHPWPVPTPRPATYILLFFLIIIWPAFNLLLLIPGQYEIDYNLMDPVLFIFIPTMAIEWFIVLCVGLVLWREKAALPSLGLVRFRIRDIFIGFGAYIFLHIFFAIIQLLLEELGLPFNESVNILVEKGSELPGWWLAISITAAFCEELTFRGFLITRVQAITKGGWFLPLVISSLAFGCGHSYQGLGGFILLTLLGLALGGLFLLTRSLWPVIIAHFIIDISAIYIFRLARSLGLQ